LLYESVTDIVDEMKMKEEEEDDDDDDK